MVSRSAGWRDGEQIWSVIHDGQEGEGHLDVEGEPPVAFAAIRDRLTKEHAKDGSVDFFFDIPVDLAREMTGHRHDEMPEVTFDNFVKPTFFQRVFGG